MECPICYKEVAMYKVQCGSIIPHMMCETCEHEWRMKRNPTRTGRIMTCPFCRKEETGRTAASYEKELKALYEQLDLNRPIRRQLFPDRRILTNIASPPSTEPILISGVPLMS